MAFRRSNDGRVERDKLSHLQKDVTDAAPYLVYLVARNKVAMAVFCANSEVRDEAQRSGFGDHFAIDSLMSPL